MADDSETPVVVSEFVDRMIECRNCHQPFPLSSSDQDFFKSKGFENPVRCKECRTARKAQAENHQGNGNYNSNQVPNGRFSQPARGYQDHGGARPFVRPTNPAASHGAHASESNRAPRYGIVPWVCIQEKWHCLLQVSYSPPLCNLKLDPMRGGIQLADGDKPVVAAFREAAEESAQVLRMMHAAISDKFTLHGAEPELFHVQLRFFESSGPQDMLEAYPRNRALLESAGHKESMECLGLAWLAIDSNSETQKAAFKDSGRTGLRFGKQIIEMFRAPIPSFDLLPVLTMERCALTEADDVTCAGLQSWKVSKNQKALASHDLTPLALIPPPGIYGDVDMVELRCVQYRKYPQDLPLMRLHMSAEELNAMVVKLAAEGIVVPVASVAVAASTPATAESSSTPPAPLHFVRKVKVDPFAGAKPRDELAPHPAPTVPKH